jgi:CspA family cold shock protein
MTGVVKSFNATKGYGFIVNDGDGKSVFVHYSAIVADGYKKLDAGDKVEYDVEESERGPRATNVKIVAHAEAAK